MAISFFGKTKFGKNYSSGFGYRTYIFGYHRYVQEPTVLLIPLENNEKQIQTPKVAFWCDWRFI